MRRVAASFGLAILGLLGYAVPGTAQDDAKGVIEKAIEAHGGAEALEKYPAGKVEGSGTIALLGSELDMTLESMYQLPSKMKNIIEVNFMGQTLRTVQIVNGDRAEMTVNGMEIPLDEPMLDELKQGVQLEEIYRLSPLLDAEQEYELSLLEKSPAIGGKETVGIQVTAGELKSPIELYFDKTSHLLLGVKRRGLGPDGAEADVLAELGNYEELNGVKRPMKMIVKTDDKAFLTIEVDKYTDLEEIPAKEFAIGND